MKERMIRLDDAGQIVITSQRADSPIGTNEKIEMKLRPEELDDLAWLVNKAKRCMRGMHVLRAGIHLDFMKKTQKYEPDDRD